MRKRDSNNEKNGNRGIPAVAQEASIYDVQ